MTSAIQQAFCNHTGENSAVLRSYPMLAATGLDGWCGRVCMACRPVEVRLPVPWPGLEGIARVPDRRAHWCYADALHFENYGLPAPDLRFAPFAGEQVCAHDIA